MGLKKLKLQYVVPGAAASAFVMRMEVLYQVTASCVVFLLKAKIPHRKLKVCR